MVYFSMFYDHFKKLFNQIDMKKLAIIVVIAFFATSITVSAQTSSTLSGDSKVSNTEIQGTMTPIQVDPSAVNVKSNKNTDTNTGTTTKTSTKTVTYKSYGAGKRCGSKSSKICSHADGTSHAGCCMYGSKSTKTTKTKATEKTSTSGPY